MDVVVSVDSEFIPPDEPVDRDEAQFVSACVWLRQRPVIAFIFGLFTFGIPYAMAGIGGSNPNDLQPPLATYWSSKKIKWIACLSLLGSSYLIGGQFLVAIKLSSWAVLSAPLVAVLYLGIAEVFYEILKGTDGFLLTQLHAFGREEVEPDLFGPTRLASKLVTTAPESIRPILGLLWAWLLGLVYVSTFVAGVILTVTIGLIIIALMIVFFIIGVVTKGDSEPSPRQPRPREPRKYPVIPLDDYGIVNRKGQFIFMRRKDKLYAGRRYVGFVRDGVCYYFSPYDKTPIPVYEIRDEQVYSVDSEDHLGTFKSEEVYRADGSLLYRMVRLPR